MKEHFCPVEQSTITYQGKCNWCGEKETLAQTQEPVAMWDGKYQIEFGNLSAYKHGEHSWIPLYTTPPQRTWVGLTDEEIDNINYTSAHMLAREVLAKLKEKNT